VRRPSLETDFDSRLIWLMQQLRRMSDDQVSEVFSTKISEENPVFVS